VEKRHKRQYGYPSYLPCCSSSVFSLFL